MASKSSSFPSVSANSMDIGDISIGEDGQQYIVAALSGKNGKTKNIWKVYEPEEVIPEIVEPPPVQEAVNPVQNDKISKKKSDKGSKSSSSDEQNKTTKKKSEKSVEIPAPEPVTEIVKEIPSEKKEKKEQKKEKKLKNTDDESDKAPEKTKRLPNEYNRFISTKMAEYRESHPEITNGREKMKMAAAEWKALKV